MDKTAVRKELLKSRDALGKAEVQRYSHAICEKLQNFVTGKRIMVYMAKDNEVDIDEFVRYWLSEGKEICVPVCFDHGRMEASLVHDYDNDFEVRSFNIREPKRDKEDFVEAKTLDAVIVPGVGFDLKGNRIGFGGGFYDRYNPRTNKNCKKIAVAYECQVVEDAVPEPHDFPMNFLVTEKKVLTFFDNRV